MNKDRKDHIQSNRLSFRLLLYILMCSVAFTCAVTSVQLYMTYRKNLDDIENVMSLIRDSYLKPLETSLWSYDMNLMMVQTKGILTLPYVKKAVLSELGNGKEREIISIGNIQDKRYVERVFLLNHLDQNETKTIGVIKVYSGLDTIVDGIWHTALMTFLMKTIEILILSFCILYIFHHVIMKHLNEIALFLKNLDIDNLEDYLHLSRKTQKNPDILDYIVAAVNIINHQLSEDISQRKKVEEQLRKSNMELMLSRNDIENQNRIKTSRMEVSDILRDEQPLESLAHRLTSHLCAEFKAGAGIFYYYDETQDMIRGVAGYAVNGLDVANLSFRPGEGLVGQVFSDKRMMIADMPENKPLNIHSALGESFPRHVLIHPFIREDRVVCLIEFGGFRPFTGDHGTLLDQIGEIVAIAAESAAVRTQKSALVEELNKTIRELSDRDQAFRQTEGKLKTVFDKSSNMIVFTDMFGHVTDKNETASHYSSCKESDTVGKPVWDAFFWSEEGKNKLNQIFSGKDSFPEKRQLFVVSDESGRTVHYDILFCPLNEGPDEPHGVFMDGIRIV